MASAQTAAPTAAPAAAAPARTSAPAGTQAARPANAGARRPIGAAAQGGAAGEATDVQSFGDWTVRCFNVKAAAPCDMIQIAVNKEKKQRVTSVSLAYVPSRDNYAAQIIVPMGVSFQTGLTLAAGDKKIEGLKFRRCENDGCYVETGLAKTAVEQLQYGGNSGTITVALYRSNKPISLPMSMNGFVQAASKLKELARAKAVVTPPAAAATPAPAPAPAAPAAPPPQ
jgi:invasion protein IalB